MEETTIMQLLITFIIGLLTGACLAAFFAVVIYPKLESFFEKFGAFMQKVKLFLWKRT